MSRFDKNFNNVDPESSRPFSGGHPDGTWVISIIYGLILLLSWIAILVGIFSSLFGDKINLFPVVAGTFGIAVFLPVIILLFKRSIKALFSCLFILVLALSGVISSYLYNPSLLYGLMAVTLAQGYICLYVYGLKRDNLLFNQ